MTTKTAKENVFQLATKLSPAGDQTQAIEKLVAGLACGYNRQTLLGVTGSGKTFTMANVIARWGRPTLIISHNKTLAAQLFGEMRSLFPHNAVEYFVSYYDYYQPEAYLPTTDTYIEKDASINEELDRLRLRATSSLLQRRDVIIIASVSCIYGLGSPQEYGEMTIILSPPDTIEQRALMRKLVSIQYERNDTDFHHGTFRVRGDVVDIFPAYEETAYRLEFFGDTLEKLSLLNPLTGEAGEEQTRLVIYPAKHFVTSEAKLSAALASIKEELEERLVFLRKENKLLEAQRLEQRTSFDMEMLTEIGYCSGIENYSRHLDGRKPGERPNVLLDYFPADFLTIIDESHVTIPQLHGMFEGDRSRKLTLVEHGFRLPSALDNRPLYFDEFIGLVDNLLFTSATPSKYEFDECQQVVEQIIRPTGLVDPKIDVRPAEGQIDDLMGELADCVKGEERALVTTLTKRMAEDLAEYLHQAGFKVRYLHSEINTIERVEILRDLRLGNFDILVGINLLREGLDLPEVSLVAILDADKEGFLRDQRSIIQTAGRASRNVRGKVLLYAAHVTKSMKRAIAESERRRNIQLKYNRKHHITPKSIIKSIDQVMATTRVADAGQEIASGVDEFDWPRDVESEVLIAELKRSLRGFSEEMRYEEALRLRDEIRRLKPTAPLLDTAGEKAVSPDDKAENIFALKERMRRAAEEMNFEEAIRLRERASKMAGEARRKARREAPVKGVSYRRGGKKEIEEILALDKELSRAKRSGGEKLAQVLAELEKRMWQSAHEQKFELSAKIRDVIRRLKEE